MTNFDKEKTIEYGKEFFDLLDRFLISDLKTMIEEIGERERGGLGYPAIHSIISGIELLGLVMSGKTKEDAFNFFWENYFEKRCPDYKGANKMVYKTVRHGTAHFFLVKFGVSVSKSGENHFKLLKIKGETYFNIDLKKFFLDFKSCYEEIKNSILLSQDEKKLFQFACGYQQLLRQMQGGRSEVEQFLKSRNYEKNSDLQPVRSSVECNVSASCICPLPQTTTMPPDYWFKRKDNKSGK